MSRVNIELHDNFTFSVVLPIMISHINSGNHLANEHLVAFLNEARLQFMNAKQVNEYKDHGLFFVVADLAVVYQTEGKYGESLKLEVAPRNFHAKGFDMVYRVTEASSGRPIAMAKTAHILFDPNAQSSVAIPLDLKSKLESL